MRRMLSRPTWFAWLLAGSVASACCAGGVFAQTCPLPKPLPAFTTQPAPNGATKQVARVHQIESRVPLGPYGVLAFGDSIVARWTGQSFSTALGAHTLDAGVGGYGTGDLLWFLENVPLGPQRPSRIFLLIGTNNLNAPGCNVYWGIRVSVDRLHRMYPSAAIIVSSVLPRGAMLLQHAATIATLNRALAEDTGGYYYFNIHDAFGAACNRRTPCSLLQPDNLHPSVAGYQFLTTRLQSFVRTAKVP
jgi:GDSL-like Lipase/Acylhydrolase family